jgi:DNA-binding PadR family transcriptional regulator
MSDPSSFLPLREATYFILLSLEPGAKHGYAILKDVTALSLGRVELSTGTLYGALRRLDEQLLIRRIDDPRPDGSERVRHVYELTGLGHHVIQAEAQRLETLLVAAQSRLRLAPRAGPSA